MDKDVTEQVSFSDNDSEALPITKCVCGATFEVWDFTISIYPKYANECPNCKRELYFRNAIRVYEVVNDQPL